MALLDVDGDRQVTAEEILVVFKQVGSAHARVGCVC